MNLIRIVILFSSIIFLLLGVAIFLNFNFIPFSLLIFFSVITIIFTSLLLYLVTVIEFHQKKPLSNFNDRKSGEVNPVIFTARSVFPFQIFPDTYILQEKTLSIVRKKFFFNAWLETIPIKDIASVRLYTGPLFVSLSILRKILPQTSIELRDMWKNDGIKLMELLDALIMKENKLVNIPKKISLKFKKKLIYEIGSEKEIEKEI
ncbi:hypothetical protein A2954_00300 [Candidatus Roizmanbacteria bacterium RIFCSPLOWO2_01_FULL_37_12]|uniref:Uncharacterized protein n=1 Tax=Candidatus Roizmanbacteria bacterium RIFCSPLOWO2_01_FULL_37_12 TaxID=1802056 RepID=A0A1F7IB66_9BACT|nr:MAG: hypothetical protein A2768_00485 [Candidatus Roizmanbacteria bacterium RIFCSPHIGHO2_01_FULL_37_16]OGK25917.1 MAG: hypothetical protein A3D76_06785 [Candidatus Roizmanbacteria bacterium RIFCSPHIGHO2_02_FULL_37_9b]OGK40605.1 MAG: hypothetical protein A2954_00300 [Candidatus Roizmanbacteria bacterium RIFCSPLOWO2_01_FULL_37_12]